MRPLGTDFEHLALDGYVNINAFYRQSDRLHGTETFMGDWAGTLLVLAQDFCHAGFVRERLRCNPDVNPFQHDPQRTINGNLLRLLAPFLPSVDLSGKDAQACGALYANIIWLLKDTPKIDSPPPDWRRAVEVSRPTVMATLDGMQRLRAVLCRGQLAYEGMLQLLGITGRSWRSDLGRDQVLFASGIRIVPTAHRVANRAIGSYPIGYRGDLMRRDIEKCFG